MHSARTILYIPLRVKHILYSFPAITLDRIVSNENGDSCKPSGPGLSQEPVFLAANYFFAKTKAFSEYLSSCYLICTIVGNSTTAIDNLYHRGARPGLSQSTCALVILFAPL